MPKITALSAAAAAAAAAAALTATQEEPTRPRPIDENGRALDEWGLPLSGPARRRALGGRTDPAIDPTGWVEVAEEPLAVLPVEVPPEPVDAAPVETPVETGATEPPATIPTEN